MGTSKEAGNVKSKKPFNTLYRKELKYSDVLFKIYLPKTTTQEEHEYLYFEISQLFCSI